MQGLVAIITAVVSGEASEAVGRARRAAIVYLLAGMLGFAGITFLLIAGFIAVAREIGTLEAALAFGGGFVALAILIVLAYRVVSSVRKRRVSQRRKSEVKAVAGAAALAVLPSLLARRGGGIALAVPALAALAYAVYRENTKRPGPPPS